MLASSSRRYFLKEKAKEQLLLEFSVKLKVSPKELFSPKTQVELVETQVAKVFLVNSRPLLASYADTLLPTLLFDEALKLLPKTIVNMGAVPYICNGADVMAPGVVQNEGEFQADEFILVIDERHSKPLAVGKTLYDSETLKTLAKGRIIKNLHYVSDRLWKLLREF